MNLFQTADVLPPGPLGDMWFAITSYMPVLLTALVVFLIGWIVATIMYRLVLELTRSMRLDDAMRRAGVNDAAKEAGLQFSASRFLASLVMWFIMVIFLVAAFEILGLRAVTVFLQRVIMLYFPNAIIASLIIIVGAIAADAAKRIVAGSARATGAYAGNLAGAIAKYSIWVIAILAAMTQVGVGTAFVQTLFTGIVIALSLAFGLAFGLGGKDAAAKAIEDIKEEIKHDF